MSRYYQASGSGIIYYNLTILAWATLLFSFCLEFGLNYSLASGKISASKLTGLSLIWTISAGILSFIILKYYFKKFTLGTAGVSFLYISISYITGNLLITYFSALFYSLKNFVMPNLILAAGNCILILLIPKKTILSLSQDYFIYIYFVSFLIQGIVLFSIFLIKDVTSLKISLPNQSDMKMLFELSTWALVTNSLSMLLYRIDYWFVNHYCTPLELGNYIQASKLIQVFLVLPAIVSTTLFPVTAGGMLRNPVENIQSLSRSLFYFTIVPAIILMVTGKWLFPYVFGNSFEFMYKPFNLLVPGILAFCVICPITSYYGGKKILHVNLISLLTSVSLVTILYFLLVPAYGITAAAIISSLGYVSYAAMLLWFFSRHHTVSLAKFFTIRVKDFEWIKNLLSKSNA
jgi:O-antigen/teichoic acid export membrane protein